MKRREFLGIFGFGLVGWSSLARSEDDDILKYLINSPAVQSWKVQGGATESSLIKDKQVSGGKALRINISGKSANPWDIVAQNPVSKAITRGDKIVVAVWIKCPKSENAAGLVNLRLEVSTAPYEGLLQVSKSIAKDWALYDATVVAENDYAAGSTDLAVHLATQKQTIDLGPAFVLNMGR